MITDEPMLPIFTRIRTWWTNADRTQRVVTLGGMGALLLLLVGTALFATRPRYEILFSGLSEMEKGQIQQGLVTLGIPEQHGEPGIIKVPADKTEEAMMGLANAQKLPKESGHWDLEKYKDVTMGTSPEMEGQIIKAVLEGRIARTIEHTDGVASATVLLNIPEKRIFAEQRDHPTASVTLIEGGSGSLSRKNGRTIANLVCNAVSGMTLADVFVASNSLGVLWDGKDINGGGAGGTKAELDAKASQDWETKIQAALDVPFGPNNTKVVVRADLDMDRKTEDSHVVTPTEKPVASSTTSETMQGTKPGAGGIAGAKSNTSAAALAQPAPTNGSTNNYQNDGKVVQFDASHSDSHTEAAVGDLKGMAITVIANSDKVANPKDVQSIINGILGGKIKMDAQGVPLPDQAFSATVTSVKFDGSASAAAKAAADAAAGQQRTQQILSLLPIGAILLVALLVARQVGKISRSILPAAPSENDSLAESEGMSALAAYEGNEAQPALDAPAKPAFPGFELEEFKDRVDVPLESLKKMATERPEMVATLIKSMMLGEKL